MFTKTKKTKEIIATKGGQTIEGVVVSNKMMKTIVVEANRFLKHPKYDKFFQVTKRYKAHDEAMKAKVGDKVTIRETRPISKDKHFEVVFAK